MNSSRHTFIFFITLFVYNFIFLYCQNSKIQNDRDNQIKFEQAQEFYDQGRVESSLFLLESLCPTGQEIPEHCYFLAGLLSKQSKKSRAIEILINTIEKNSRNFQIHRMLAYLYLEKGQLGKAYYHSRISLSLKKDDRVTLINLARVLDLMESPEASLLIYRKVLKMYAQDKQALHFLSLFYFRKSDYKKAYQSQLKVGKQDKYKCYFGELLHYVNKFNLAINTLNDCLKQDAQRNSAIYILSLSYLKIRKFQKACNVAQRLYLKQKKRKSLPVLIVCNYYLKKYKVADGFVKELQKRKAKNIHIVYYMALIRARLNDHVSAISLYKKVIKSKQSNPELNYNIAVSYEKIGKPLEALGHYKKACQESDKEACRQVLRLGRGR